MKIIPALFVISVLMVSSGCIVVFMRGISQGWGPILISIPIAGVLWMLLNSLLIGIAYLVWLKRVEQRFSSLNVAFLAIALSLFSGFGVYYL